MGKNKIDVLVISGSGRSGSTLLLRVLGSLDGFCAIGELNNLWEQSIMNNGLCSCGRPFHNCEFWCAVMDDAFGGVDHVDAHHMIALRNSTVRAKYAPFLVQSKIRTESFQCRVREYADALETIYQSIHKVSGCNVIVDSSKGGGHASMLAEMPSVRPGMIHLVRDSRATAYSWMRKKKRTDVRVQEKYMGEISPRKVAMHWNVGHTFATLASRRFTKNVMCRYEDFTTEPQMTMIDMLARLDMEKGTLHQFTSPNQVSLSDDHCLWGNPDRMMRGTVTIRPDMAWREKMPVKEKLQVTLLTLPWLVKYGYLTAGEVSKGD